MKLESVCLVMTACISPPAQVINLCVKDMDYRKQQYIEAICFYIEKTEVKNIVFCDNSAQPVNEMLCRRAKEKRKNFEWLSFQGDYQKVEELGKGYGEGEILEYVVNNSKLLKKCNYMAKITGRLKLLNINAVLRLLSTSAFHFRSYLHEDNGLFVDTRFFVARIDHFRGELVDVYKKVNDSIGFYYEYAIASRVQEKGIMYRNFPLALNMAGESGSTGYSYHWTWKMLVKKSIPLFAYYFFHLGNPYSANGKSGEELVWGDYVWYKNFMELEGKRIILYGAGSIGKKLYVLCNNRCLIVAWADENYKRIRKVGGEKIIAPALINTYEFDYIVIAVRDEIIVRQVKDYIINMGISSDKVVWGLPIL